MSGDVTILLHKGRLQFDDKTEAELAHTHTNTHTYTDTHTQVERVRK